MKDVGHGLFVTGTDTGIGKTQVACGLLRAFARRGCSVIGMKPVAAGTQRRDGVALNADVEALRRASTLPAARTLRNPYAFAPPLAPHLAARDMGVQMQLGSIVQAYRQLAARADMVIVEGIGGFRVPLTGRLDTADLAERLGLPVILVVGMRLGCLSHALLTAEAIAQRDLELAGWVANRIDPRMRRYRDNVAALHERLQAPLIAEIPYCSHLHRRNSIVDRRLDIAPLTVQQ